MDALWAQINEAIHSKNSQAVGALIGKYLRAKKNYPEAIYEASEFFRKNADYASALRVLPRERVSTARLNSTEIETKLELQLARILNILGASRYALRMIDRIRLENGAKSKVEMVEVYHCNYKYKEVLDLIGPNYPCPKSEPWHQDWLLHFYYAYALNALKHRSLAIERVEQIHGLTKSPLIQAIALSFKGQFLVEEGALNEALPILIQSRKFFPKDDPSFDHAHAEKWLGICLLKLGRFGEAEAALKRSFDIVYQPSFKPEDWMEILLRLAQFPGRLNQQKSLNSRILALGGSECISHSQAGPFAQVEQETLFSVGGIESSPKANHIDRRSNTKWHGSKARLGLDLIDELICVLIYAGEHGLPQFRIYELLWPSEPFSFHQHQKRLERLVGRARTRGHEVIWKDLHLRLKSKNVTTSSLSRDVVQGYSFLVEHPEFTRRDVEKYFAISGTTAKALCRGWLSDGHAKPLRNFRYRSALI